MTFTARDGFIGKLKIANFKDILKNIGKYESTA
jgi:hypothetical protein